MSVTKDRISALELTSYAAASFDGAYHAINPLGFEGAACYIVINNYTDKAIFISYDGIKDHTFIPADSSLIVPNQSSSQPTNHRALFPKRQIVYVKSAVAGAGSVYLHGFYQ